MEAKPWSFLLRRNNAKNCGEKMKTGFEKAFLADSSLVTLWGNEQTDFGTCAKLCFLWFSTTTVRQRLAAS